MIEIVLILAIIVVAYLIIHKISHSIFIVKIAMKIISIVFGSFFIIVLVSAFFMLNDANNFRKNFSNSTNLFILENNDTFLSGVELNHQGKPYVSMTSEGLSDAQRKYKSGDMNDLVPAYYKIFVIDIKTFDSLPSYKITDRNIDLTRDEVEKILLSNDAKQDFAAISAIKRNETTEYALAELSGIEDAGIKNYIFSYSISYFFNPRNTDKLLIKIKDGDIQVFKETAMFKAIRLIPNFMVKNILKTKSDNTTSITGNIVLPKFNY